MAKFNAIKIILALGATMDLEMHQMNVKIAFLNNKLDVEIYMEQSGGFEQTNREHLICKLRKSFYKLKQSRRAWYEQIYISFVKKGFMRSQAGHSLYV